MPNMAPPADELAPEKLSPESVSNAIKEGRFLDVKVKRSSGEMEDGWIVTGTNGENAAVAKILEDESILRKTVPLEELKEWNK